MKYKENVGSALKTICPSGKVSAKKLIEVIDDTFQNYLNVIS